MKVRLQKKIFDLVTSTSKKSLFICTGADRLITHFYNNNIPICVATSSSKESFTIKTKNHCELFELFDHIVMGASDVEVKKGKPAPDIFEIAAKRFKDRPKYENVGFFNSLTINPFQSFQNPPVVFPLVEFGFINECL